MANSKSITKVRKLIQLGESKEFRNQMKRSFEFKSERGPGCIALAAEGILGSIRLSNLLTVARLGVFCSLRRSFLASTLVLRGPLLLNYHFGGGFRCSWLEGGMEEL